ncbi:60S ribosomal protein L18a-like protein isoform X2 [Coffea eugenioides]|uniref:60S ribosomal protein L18a-like protein isoform X2 n=1 Tax=Coffea eugenioides TaxID=49369 RepID=UPI000F60FE36|nr:60S ribosomal protein L18a-like protein isoform X2 [Coffea eugenioides]
MANPGHSRISQSPSTSTPASRNVVASVSSIAKMSRGAEKDEAVSITISTSARRDDEQVFDRQYHYGTFQGVNTSQQPFSSPPPAPSQPVFGFPQPIPPPGITISPPYCYHHTYQGVVPGYAVVEGMPIREHRLPCCGIGIGWFLFIFGFFFGAIPWYIGAFLLLCVRLDYREKPGLIACTLASILALIAITIGVTNATNSW